MKWASICSIRSVCGNFKNTAIIFSTTLLIFHLPTYAAAAGLVNPGFESGALAPWQTIPPADVATVVGEEGAEFKTYADLGITVSPKIGQYMLRLGSPKQIAEKQNRGDNIVFQTFSSTEDKLNFAARLFSWEPRGDDSVIFDLKDSNGNTIPGIAVTGELGSALSLNVGPGQAASCTTLPCKFIIDAGKSGDFINTGWVVFELTGLPTDGSQVTLEYKLVGGQNEAHATWAYFDNANNPPIARFTVNRLGPLEGDGVILTNESYDPDPNDSIVANNWSVIDPSCNCERGFDTKNISLLFSDNGTYTVKLTVTDSFGASDTAFSGAVARDGTYVPALTYTNGAPLAKALSQEVLVGEQTELLARFVDPGFEDTHTASWYVSSGSTSNEQILEESAPFISSGIATATYTAPDFPGTVAGQVTISDNDGSSAFSEFEIKVLDYQLGRHEPNNDLTSAPILNSDWKYRSDLSTKGDIDIFEARLPDGSSLPAGSELLVKLGNLQTDLDLVVLRQIPDLGNTPFLFGRTPFLFGRTPFLFGRTPFLFGRTPFLFGRTPFLFGRTPFLFGRTPFLFGRTPWLRDPLADGFDSPLISFDQIPLTELAFVAPDGTGLSEDDINLGELGLGELTDPGLVVAAYSTNRGLKDEEILIRTDFTDAALYIAVVGNNGAFTKTPYSLQLETSRPMQVETLAGDSCNGSPLVPANKATSSVDIIHSAGKKALFITQRERMKAIYGDSEWSTLEANLIAVANKVQGSVISIASSLYDNWDINPCRVEEANSVASAIRTEIFNQKDATTEYITLVGSDHIIPQRRIPDATSISNERYYTMGSSLIPGTPLYASVFTGQNLSDDYYADENPLVDQKTVLYIPDLVISRLVEKPAEISNVINEFINNQGQLALSTATVTGYDIFNDGALQTANALSMSMTTTTMINNMWTADDLRCEMFGTATGDPTCPNHNVNNFNAHFTHYLAQSAFGFDYELDDLFNSTEVAGAGTGNGDFPLKNDLSFTLGCHAGMNIPDGDVTLLDSSSGIDNSLDFAQAMARQGSVYIASTGYGLAGVNSIAGTEKLLALFAEELSSSATVGKALLKAKQRYLSGLSTITEYDEKASIQTTLYGLPMYNLTFPNASAASPALTGNAVSQVNLTIFDDSQNSTSIYTLEEITTSAGNYFAVDGEHEATPARPIQPKILSPLNSSAESAHGLLITAGSYSDIDPYDPVVARPTTEWELDAGEANVCLNAFWPSQLASVKSPKLGADQTAIVIPAQFRCTSGSNSAVAGIERVFDNLTIEVLRSTSNDYNAPVIKEVDIRVPGNGTADISIDAFDDAGTISQIVLLVLDNGAITTIDSGPLNSVNGPYSLHIANFTDAVNVVLQVVDDAGNVAIWVGKGVNVRGIEVNAADSILYSTLSPTRFTATIKDFSKLLEEADSMNFTWDFGDGEFETGLLAQNGQPTALVTVDQTGTATFTVEHLYTTTGNFVAEVKITDSFGGIGIDTVQMQSCSDAADIPFAPNGDLVGCSITNNGSSLSVQLQVAGVISNDFQYRLSFDLGGTGSDPVPDGESDLTMKWDNGNVTNSGKLNSLVGHLLNNNTVEFTFDLQETKFSGSWFKWQAETQSGVQAQPGVGFVDQMPDGVMFNYTFQ
ncbi:MAG: PKD domain-containing protein [Gammaproteobacteria bacterium]|nr:PKD domain-containing protein [Gammaproteobacteria bacterium]